LNQEIAQDLPASIDQFVAIGNEVGPALVRVLVLVLLALVATQYLGGLLSKLLVRRGLSERKALFPVTLLHVLVLLATAIVTLIWLGYPVVNLVRGIAGIMLLLTAAFVILRPYLPGFPMSRGDVVSLGSTLGTVEKITFANTLVKTFDGQMVFVPNYNLLNEPLTNSSLNPSRRLDVGFYVPYDEDLDTVKQLVMRVLETDERVLEEPAPVVVVTELSPSYREMLARFWTSSGGWLATHWAIREKIDNAFSSQDMRLGVPRVEIVNAPSPVSPTHTADPTS
jgi:small conductance mechanosensitive channel